MKNEQLLAILKAFKALFDNLPQELPNEEYLPAVKRLEQSYSEILYPLLGTQYYAFNADPNGDSVSIFDTDIKRDAYVEEMCKVGNELQERGDVVKPICEPITFEEFMERVRKYANSVVLDLNNYSLDEDGAIELVLYTED